MLCFSHNFLWQDAHAQASAHVRQNSELQNSHKCTDASLHLFLRVEQFAQRDCIMLRMVSYKYSSLKFSFVV